MKVTFELEHLLIHLPYRSYLKRHLFTGPLNITYDTCKTYELRNLLSLTICNDPTIGYQKQSKAKVVNHEHGICQHRR